LRERAVQIHVEDHLRARLERGDRLRVKLGLDPTAPDLHVGHLVVLDVLRDFQDDGHTVVLIIGDYTALIGDPSGRSETRPMLTEAQVTANAETYFQQLSLVLDRKQIEVRHNSEWLAAMTAADILRLMAKATLQQVLQREEYVRLISGFEATEPADVLATKPRAVKAATARQLLKRLHGEEAAKRAEEDFNIKFRKREIPEGIEERTVTDPRDLVMVLVETGLRDSRGDARRLIEQGGVRINGQKAGADAILKDGDVLQAGKRSFVRIRVG